MKKKTILIIVIIAIIILLAIALFPLIKKKIGLAPLMIPMEMCLCMPPSMYSTSGGSGAGFAYSDPVILFNNCLDSPECTTGVCKVRYTKGYGPTGPFNANYEVEIPCSKVKA